MNLALAAAGALTLTFTLAGCGSSPRPSVGPDLAADPTWGGCSQFSQQQMSIAEGVQGTDTLAAAVADYREHGDRMVTAPPAGGLSHRWLVAADGTIHADLELWDSHRGWFVTGVKQCAER